MIAPRLQPDASQRWDGHWTVDERLYARRSDGACFAIEAGVTVMELAGSESLSQARPVESLPGTGRRARSVFAVRVLDARAGAAHDALPGTGPSPNASPRLLAYGMRRKR